MSSSSGSNDSGVPADEHGMTLIDDRLDDIALPRDREGYRARHAQPDIDVEPAEVTVGVVEPSAGTAVVELADEWDEPEDFRLIARPYTWTRGRTRPVQDLAVETLVSTSDVGRDVVAVQSAEHSAIAGLCADVRSVAEVAALLALPLGVARVLLADMIDTGLVNVHRNPTEFGSPSGLSLMERVLAGLYEL